MAAVESMEHTTVEYTLAHQPRGGLVLVLPGDEERPPLPLSGRPVSIGRSVRCDLVLNDRYVSLEHCEVREMGGRLAVRDLGSRNGTVLNGARVTEGLAGPGARLLVGRQLLLCLEAGPRPGSFSGPAGLVGRTGAMRRLSAELTRFGPRRAPVLLVGETGTGKELAARALHELSPRGESPFVAVNCGALTPELAMSELLGHERGSFTGAASLHRGAFEQADGGTLFLDEVGELDPRVQAALLRVLETRRVRRVGGSEEVPVDVRVVSATNRDLGAAVGVGTFRRDLFHRVAVLVVELPPLRERLADLPDLAAELLARMGDSHDIEPEALELLGRHHWPGNVRELKNVLERAAALARGSVITARDLRMECDLGLVLDGEAASLKALVASHGSVAAAARAVGLPRTTLRDRLVRVGGYSPG